MIDGAARGSPKCIETTWGSVHVMEAHRRDPVNIPRVPDNVVLVVDFRYWGCRVDFPIVAKYPPCGTVRRPRRLSLPQRASKYLSIHYPREDTEEHAESSPRLPRNSFPGGRHDCTRVSQISHLRSSRTRDRFADGTDRPESGESGPGQVSSLLLSILEEKLDAVVFAQGSFGDATYFIDHLPLRFPHKHVEQDCGKKKHLEEKTEVNPWKKDWMSERINLICTTNNHARCPAIRDWRVHLRLFEV